MKPLMLVNMGGPTTSDEVAPYLEAIFRDPAILPVPSFFRGATARLLSRRRAPEVCERYDLIGGGSPLSATTEAQARRVAELYDGEVHHAFRYTRPTIEEAVRHIGRDFRLLPLFPHYTDAMSGSVEREAQRVAEALGVGVEVIGAWGQHPAVLAIWRRLLDEALDEAGPQTRVLFVAHGVPMRNVRRGDPYPREVEASARALGRALPAGTTWSLAYQSRVGPVAWTQPYMEDELERLVTASKAPLVLMPLSFVADCLETLYDLDALAAPEASEAGVERVIRVPAFNDRRDFAAALATIAAETEEVAA